MKISCHVMILFSPIVLLYPSPSCPCICTRAVWFLLHQIICQKHFCYFHFHKTLSIFHIVLLIDCAHNTDVYNGIKPLKLLCWRGGKHHVHCVLSRVSMHQYAVLKFTDHTASLFSGVAIRLIFIVMSKSTAAKLRTKLQTTLKVTGGSGSLMQPCTLTPVSLHWPRGWGLQIQLHLQPPLVFLLYLQSIWSLSQ